MLNDYPLAPEKLKVSHDMLSNYCSNIENEDGIKFGSVNKLVPNLDKESSVLFVIRSETS